MTHAILPVVIDNAEFLTEEALPDIVGRRASAEDVLDFCTQLRRLGIAELLIKGTPDALLRELSFSGRAFLHVLPTIPERRRAAGEQMPFLDALASGDMDCASQIARLCPTVHTQGEELEEEFLFMSSLMSLMFERRDVVAAHLARYETIVGEEEEPRLAVLRALLGGDNSGLEEALDARMTEIHRHYRRLQGKMAITDEEAETEGRISSEGIAVVRLAERLQMDIRKYYRLVPAIVWRAKWKPGADDAWKSL